MNPTFLTTIECECKGTQCGHLEEPYEHDEIWQHYDNGYKATTGVLLKG